MRALFSMKKKRNEQIHSEKRVANNKIQHLFSEVEVAKPKWLLTNVIEFSHGHFYLFNRIVSDSTFGAFVKNSTGALPRSFSVKCHAYAQHIHIIGEGVLGVANVVHCHQWCSALYWFHFHVSSFSFDGSYCHRRHHHLKPFAFVSVPFGFG